MSSQKKKEATMQSKLVFLKSKIQNSQNKWKDIFQKKIQNPKEYLKNSGLKPLINIKGNELGLEIFKDKKFIDVRSKTIGKGFAGVMKRWNFQDWERHIVSVSHRSHGSTGQRQDPVKFWKEKNGRSYGDKPRTMLNLEIIKSDIENGLLYLRGSIPGSKNSTVYLRESIKNIRRKTINEKYEAKVKKAEAKKGKK